jgi:glycosyltransferase involved in cell wall biosynthesis
MIDISVIIPYYNESGTIKITLDAINRQVYKPREIIFVNSSSTDHSSEIVNQWIEARPVSGSVKYLNINTDSKTPSSSKNIGIKESEFEWLAFMDCGLYFNKNWLKDLASRVSKKNSKIKIVSGVCQLNGYTTFDRCVVAHTYGVGTNRICIPGSLVNRSVFISTGLFLENMRASYDRAWQKKTQNLNIKRETPKNHNVSYIGINFAHSFSGLFEKITMYSKPAVLVSGYKVPVIYILAVFFIALVFAKSFFTGLIFVFFYILGRGYILPFYKSKNKESLVNINSFLFLPLVGLMIDIARFHGYLLGYKNKFFKVGR